MHLIRDGYFGENFEGSFEFSMRSGDAVVEFTVGPSLLDAIDGVYETLWEQRDEQFRRLRDRIETVAMCRFGENPSGDQMAIALSAADFQRWGGQSKPP
jgi:hypothetical protein